MSFERDSSHDAAPVVELELTDLAHGGDAVGRYAGRAIFVAGGLPGEIVRARLTVERSNYARAALVEVVRPSPDRVEPRYPELADSGGFQWQHLAYPAQLAWKTRITRQLLMRIGHFAHPAVHPMLGMPAGSDLWRYRTVAQFATGPTGAIGFRRVASREVIDMAECPIVAQSLDSLYQRVRAWLHEQWGGDVWRFVERFTVRVAANPPGSRPLGFLPPSVPPAPHPAGASPSPSGLTGTSVGRQSSGLLGLETRPGGAFDAAGGPQAIGEALLAGIPDLAGVVVLGLPGGRGRVPVGQDVIYDQVYDRIFRISAGSFFQVNASQTPVLVERVLAETHLRPSERVLDGYSGVGLFSLFLAGRAADVHAVESQPSAVADARASAALNTIGNVTTTEGVLERVLGSLNRRGERIDVVVVDPPRAGCHPRALDEIKVLEPRTFVYVSCDPSTLARDLRLFCATGYRLVSVQPVDMFPNTAHIEAIAVCERIHA